MEEELIEQSKLAMHREHAALSKITKELYVHQHIVAEKFIEKYESITRIRTRLERDFCEKPNEKYT